MTARPVDWRLRAAVRLVEALAPPKLADQIAGDLVEESADARLGPWWALWQAVISAPAFLQSASGYGLFAAAAVRFVVCYLLVLAGFRLLFGYVLTQVPLRAGHAAGSGWIAIAIVTSTVVASIIAIPTPQDSKKGRAKC